MRRILLEAQLFWAVRHNSARFTLILLGFSWAIAACWPFPDSKSWNALSYMPHVLWALWGLLGAVSLLMPRGRLRMLGGVVVALLWFAVALGTSIGNHAVSAGSAVFLALAIISLDYLAGGAR